MHVPKYLWGDVIPIPTYLVNRLPSRPTLSLLIKKCPHMSISNNLHLKTFGCATFIHVHDHHQSKLNPWVIKIVFIGYSLTRKGYHYYCPQTRKTYVSHDITFFWRYSLVLPNFASRGNPNKACWDTISSHGWPNLSKPSNTWSKPSKTCPSIGSKGRINITIGVTSQCES